MNPWHAKALPTAARGDSQPYTNFGSSARQRRPNSYFLINTFYFGLSAAATFSDTRSVKRLVAAVRLWRMSAAILKFLSRLPLPS